jgi:hypothetical protein
MTIQANLIALWRRLLPRTPMTANMRTTVRDGIGVPRL